MASDTALSLSTAANLFQTLYDNKSLITFNTATELLMKIKRENTLHGKNKVLEAVLGFNGGVGSGNLPLTNVFSEQNATLTRKKLYSRIIIEREAMLASKGGKGAFEDATKRQVQKGVESFMRNMSRSLFAFENGKLFEGDGSTVVTGAGSVGAPYVVRALASTFVQGFLEIKDYVNVGAETTSLEIVDVNPTTRDVKLVGTSATLAAVSSTGGSSSATSAKIYMQGSKDNDPKSILQVLKSTSDTSLYGIDQTATGNQRWKSTQKDAASAGLSTDLMNEVLSGIQFKVGKSPDLIVTSFKQLRKLENLLADKIRYMTVDPRSAILKKAGYGFDAVEFRGGSSGPIPVVADRMCPDDHMLFLNTDQIVLYGAGPAKWVDEDNTVFIRLAGSDAFEARYAWYGETFVNPAPHGVLYGLA